MRNCHVKDLCKSTFGNISYMLMLASVQYFPLKGDPLSYLHPRLLPGALLYMHDSKDLGTEDNPKVLPEGHHVEGQSLYYQKEQGKKSSF
ncbi:uncharacterized protein [Anas platyrhynchos]|uniref:uncharacterized protein isoform X1 n=1 Tax=Anas platyrhynchos TaxID=8839 RepID=UPI003AF2DD53